MGILRGEKMQRSQAERGIGKEGVTTVSFTNVQA
jgi:hypothetical protein